MFLKKRIHEHSYKTARDVELQVYTSRSTQPSNGVYDRTTRTLLCHFKKLNIIGSSSILYLSINECGDVKTNAIVPPVDKALQQSPSLYTLPPAPEDGVQGLDSSVPQSLIHVDLEPLCHDLAGATTATMPTIFAGRGH